MRKLLNRLSWCLHLFQQLNQLILDFFQSQNFRANIGGLQIFHIFNDTYHGSDAFQFAVMLVNEARKCLCALASLANPSQDPDDLVSKLCGS